jgi:hypothetical protein
MLGQLAPQRLGVASCSHILVAASQATEKPLRLWMSKAKVLTCGLGCLLEERLRELALALSRDGRVIASGSNTVHFWDAQTAGALLSSAECAHSQPGVNLTYLATAGG